jgi:hypothetical protein
MELSILLTALATLILLAVTSSRFGVDSREGFLAWDRDLATRSTLEAESFTDRDRRVAAEMPAARQQRPSDECNPMPCVT